MVNVWKCRDLFFKNLFFPNRQVGLYLPWLDDMLNDTHANHCHYVLKKKIHQKGEDEQPNEGDDSIGNREYPMGARSRSWWPSQYKTMT
jgi:hypothetical protein